jgi:alkaline phosphatase D
MMPGITRRKTIQYLTAAPIIIALATKVRSAQAQSDAIEDRKYFPQGVASADPSENSVLLWTRCNVSSADTKTILILQLSLTRSFRNVIVETTIEALCALDHTVRVRVENLRPSTFYFYRFVAKNGIVSPIGRTRTAPAANRDALLRVALFSCQDYDYGHFGSYRTLLERGQNHPSNEPDLIIHVGDFIYENIEPDFHDRVNDAFGRETNARLQNRDGSPRRVVFRSDPDRQSAQTLDDYRDLYRAALSDPDLIACREMYPFISIWDDHEVQEDYWQAFGANKQPGQVTIQKLKLAGNQAWYEYIPLDLTLTSHQVDDTRQLGKFNAAKDAVDEKSVQSFGKGFSGMSGANLAAVNSLLINRSIKWGKNIEFFLLDGRSFRGPRGIPAELMNPAAIGYPDHPLPRPLVKELSDGETANGGAPSMVLSHRGKKFANRRAKTPATTILGEQQSIWLKGQLDRSKAKWKILCLSMPLMQFGFDARPFGGPSDGVRWADGWDGAPGARQDLLTYIEHKKLTGVVSLSGDRHAHFCGVAGYRDAQGTVRNICPELVGASVGGLSRYELEYMSQPSAYKPYVGSIEQRGTGMTSLDLWLRFGAETARSFTENGVLATALEKADPGINPHMVYADNDAFGYVFCTVDGKSMLADFVSVSDPRIDWGSAGPRVVRTRTFQIPRPGGDNIPTEMIKSWKIFEPRP